MICECCGLPIRDGERTAPYGLRHASVGLCVTRLHEELYMLRADSLMTERLHQEARQRAERFGAALATIQTAGKSYNLPVDRRVLAVVDAALSGR